MYNPGILPLAGTDDLTLTVQQFQATWRHTLRVVDGMRGGPLDLSPTLSMSLDSLRYHVGIVLATIDAFIRSGGSLHDAAFDLPSVDVSIKLFLQELLRTKAHWNAWVEGQSASFSGVELDTTSEQQILDAAKPPTIPESLVLLAGGAIVIGALFLMD